MNLEFFIRLRDMMSSGLVKMAGTAQKTSASIRGVNGTLAQSYDNIRTKVNQLENSIARSTSINHIRTMRRELDQLNRMAARAPGNLAAGGGGFFAGGFRQLLPALGFAGAMAMGGSVIRSGLEAQARQASFEVMAGKEQGTILNKDLTKYAQDSIYGNEVFQHAQTMMAFGIDSKQVMGDMRMLGDVAQGNKDRMGRLALAYAQVKAAGKLMGQDLIQFVNAGFNPLNIMAEKTGISMAVLRDRASEGQITFEHVKAAFEAATSAGGDFYKMTEKIQNTDFGKWEAFKGQMQGLAVQVGEMLAPAFGNLISNYLAPFVTWMSESAKWIQENWSWIGMLTSVIGSLVIGYQIWLAYQNALNISMYLNPIGLLVAGIAALVAGIWWAWNHFEGFRKTIHSVWEVMKVLWEYVGVVVKPIIGYWIFQLQILKMLFTGLWEAVKWAFDKIKDYFMVVFGPIIEAIKWIWNKVAESDFGTKIAAAWNKGQMNMGMSSEEASNALGINSITPVTATGGGGLSDIWSSMKNNGGTPAEDGGVSRGIAGGGPRIINITIHKMVEKIEVTAMSVDEGIDRISEHVEEAFLRVLNSGASVQ
ncbi:MAG: tape measure protein [Cyclobacteriaceae bacterium]|nr:tape measure protein [Cyclobacteriaceae bacterium]